MKISAKRWIGTLLVASMLQGCATEEGMVRVNNVAWCPNKVVDVDTILNTLTPEGTARLVFYRPMDEDDSRTGVNIAINDDYQVSLHPGSFTTDYSCIGDNRLSNRSSELNTNDLLLKHNTSTLKNKETQYYEINVNKNRVAKSKRVSEDQARAAMAGMTYQSHQISKVIPNCALRPQPKPQPPSAPILEEKVTINLQVLFDNDKSVVKPQYLRDLSTAAEFMQKYSDTTVVIEGHTDSNASDAYNIALSKRRAQAVKEVFINQYGISPARIQAVGYGESRPIASNATAEGRQMNRRVVAVIQQK